MKPYDHNVSSAAQAAAQAWAAAMCCQKQPCTMPPWDENVYAETPVVNYFSVVPGTATQIAKGNPQRIAIIFAASPLAGGGLVIKPGSPPDPALMDGFPIQSGTLPLVFKQEDYLSLPTMSFWAIVQAGAAPVIVIEIILTQWPNPNKTPKGYKPIKTPPVYTPPATTVPSANGTSDTGITSPWGGYPTADGSPAVGYPVVGGVPIVTQPLSHDYDSGGSGTSTPTGNPILPE